MAQRNPPLPAPSSTGWMAIRVPSPKICSSLASVWNALEIAADADHPFMGYPPFQLERGAERGERQRAAVVKDLIRDAADRLECRDMARRTVRMSWCRTNRAQISRLKLAPGRCRLEDRNTISHSPRSRLLHNTAPFTFVRLAAEIVHVFSAIHDARVVAPYVGITCA